MRATSPRCSPWEAHPLRRCRMRCRRGRLTSRSRCAASPTRSRSRRAASIWLVCSRSATTLPTSMLRSTSGWCSPTANTSGSDTTSHVRPCTTRSPRPDDICCIGRSSTCCSPRTGRIVPGRRRRRGGRLGRHRRDARELPGRRAWGDGCALAERVAPRRRARPGPSRSARLRARCRRRGRRPGRPRVPRPPRGVDVRRRRCSDSTSTSTRCCRSGSSTPTSGRTIRTACSRTSTRRSGCAPTASGSSASTCPDPTNA